MLQGDFNELIAYVCLENKQCEIYSERKQQLVSCHTICISIMVTLPFKCLGSVRLYFFILILLFKDTNFSKMTQDIYNVTKVLLNFIFIKDS